MRQRWPACRTSQSDRSAHGRAPKAESCADAGASGAAHAALTYMGQFGEQHELRTIATAATDERLTERLIG